MTFNFTVDCDSTDLFELIMEKGEWLGAKLENSKIWILYSPQKEVKTFFIELDLTGYHFGQSMKLEIRRYYGIISAGLITGEEEFKQEFNSEAIHIDNLLEQSRYVKTNEFRYKNKKD